jgi:pilus assembly protein TadC
MVMVAVSRVLSVVVMVLLPGGLLIAAAWVLSRMVLHQMQLEEGSQSHRLARAMATVKFRDVVRETRRLW